MDLALDKKKRKSKTISFSYVGRRKRKVSLPALLAIAVTVGSNLNSLNSERK